MPQGGITAGEGHARRRCASSRRRPACVSVELLAEAPGWLTYDLPDELLGIALKGRYRGQRQKWFAMRFTGNESEIDIAPRNGHKAEFDAWRWAPARDAAPDRAVQAADLPRRGGGVANDRVVEIGVSRGGARRKTQLDPPSLARQRPESIHGEGGGETGGVVAGGGELGLGRLQLGSNDDNIHLLHRKRALGEHGQVAGIDLGKPALDEDARLAGVPAGPPRSRRGAAPRSPEHGRAAR